MVTPYERTKNFILGQKKDRPPFHPILMRFAAKYLGVNYKDFCLDYETKCKAMIKCAEDFELDWVTVLSDPYVETQAYGLPFKYPENDIPALQSNLDLEETYNLKTFEDIYKYSRMRNRINEIIEYKTKLDDKYFIVGWVEGPLAEYCSLRGFGTACMDLYQNPNTVYKAADKIVENAKKFITEQVKAGAHCVGIGDSASSQIMPDMYRRIFFNRQKEIVEHIHSLNAFAKLHICGNTSEILPDMIKTECDIVDVDHLVGSMEPYSQLLGAHQVLSGNSDPVTVIQKGNKKKIFESVKNCFNETDGKNIVSAGCEITPQTSIENIKNYCESVKDLI